MAGPTLAIRRHRRRVPPAEQFTINIMTEQEPSRESRITLGRERDRYGVPRARITWNPTHKTWQTIVGFSRIIRDEFDAAGLGKVVFFPSVVESCAFWNVYPHDMYHHIGATRMAESPEHGVVDPECKVFGMENLYIVSSSVFPTSGHSNCTLTIMALAFRLLANTERAEPCGNAA
jgi:choline dehydrogenase-like flavoprotein